MTSALQTRDKSTSPALNWAEARIAGALGNDSFLLSDGRLARQAMSCLITPEGGDRVLTIATGDGSHFVLHVLERSGDEVAELHVPGAERLRVRQPQIALDAADGITLRARNDIEVSAATGTLALNARNLFATVHDSLIQNVRHFVGKADQYLLDVKQLLKMHAQHTLITAEQDVKVDGERISVG